MTDLLQSNWKWDFVLNLSESDFPIKTIDKLEVFLTSNRNKNFVKSHGREVQRFIQKQGLDKTFVECDTHMWRIGDRLLPLGIEIDGGSDWICLSRDFVKYVTNPEKDDLITGLLKIFQHTLLPAESFFHTSIRNSKFCNTYLDNNLHITNWKRKLGCKCQYKHVVDWCGCSPNDFKPDDWPRLLATEHKQLFFGRKFEPIVNQMIILQLEEWLFGPYSPDVVHLNSYWQNLYHYKDKSPAPNRILLTIANSLIRINSKSNQFQEFYRPLRILEIHDYSENDLYRGFLIRHEAKINENITLELETWCRPLTVAQVSKSVKIASKIMQFEVSTDLDPKEQIFRNIQKVMGPKSEPIMLLKLSGSSRPENATANFTVLWVDPKNNVVDSSDLIIEDLTVTSINFSKSNLKHPLMHGVWTVKLLYKKALIGHTKFLITPIEDVNEKVENTKVESKPNTSDSLKSIFNNSIDKMVANFYQIKDSCVIYSQNNIRNIITSYLSFDRNSSSVQKFHKFVECKKTSWSSRADDPKSDIFTMNDSVHFEKS
jgi:protein xylosyltransferase